MKQKENTPTLIKAGDERVLIKGKPVAVDFRMVAESRYQWMIKQPNKALWFGFLLGSCFATMLTLIIIMNIN